MNAPAIPEGFEALAEFVEHPDTVSILSHYDSRHVNFLQNHPYIRVGRVLAGNYVISYVSRDHMPELTTEYTDFAFNAVPGVVGLTDRLDLEAAGVLQIRQQPYLSLRGNGVLLGLIDTGIDYVQDAFRYEDGTTKIRYLWDQSISGGPPEGFPLGTEYTADQINEALRSDNPRAIVPSEDTDGHGTFLASLMGARGPELDQGGAAPDADFVVVKLRQTSAYTREQQLIPSWQPSAFNSADVMLGVEYLLEKATELNMPIAICLSLGTNLGGHNGFTLFEQYMTHVSYRNGVTVCIAAGNEGQARHHTEGIVTATGDSQTMDIRIPENADDVFISVVSTSADRLSVSVTSPTGEIVGRIPSRNGLIIDAKLVMERSRVQIAYHYNMEGGGQRSYVKLFEPTPGIWTLTVHGDAVINGAYHAYLPLTGFVTPGIEFLAPVPYTTIVVPATTLGTITVGGFNAKNNALYIDSSWGPTRAPVISPDLVAPAVDVGGLYPGGPGTMTGTSCAAAIAAGACALMLQWGIVDGHDPYINTHRMRAYLIRGCDRDPNLRYPNEQWGYGRLNLLSTFNQMRETVT